MINAVSIASVPLQANTPTIVSMAGPQIIASTSCGTPLSISANTTQGQQMAALAQQSLNTLSTTSHHQVALNASAQILGTSQITLTPTLATGKRSHSFPFFKYFCLSSNVCPFHMHSTIDGSHAEHIPADFLCVKRLAAHYFLSGDDT